MYGVFKNERGFAGVFWTQISGVAVLVFSYSCCQLFSSLSAGGVSRARPYTNLNLHCLDLRITVY